MITSNARWSPPRASSTRRASLSSLTSARRVIRAAPAAATEGSATLTVRDQSGRAAELLHRLTLAQLAAALNTTPAQLRAQIEAPDGEVAVSLGELLSNPSATLEDVINLLEAHGVSTA